MHQRRSKVLQTPSGRGALYTFHPMKTRRGKLTHKEVDARHLYLPSGSWPSTPRTQRTMGSSQNLDFSDFPNSLDIPNSDWVSRLWRDLKHRKWFGCGHEMEQDPGDGGLTLFCPKPGVNLPEDWKVQYDRDGHFTAQHMKMNMPELDVALSDGKGFMVVEVPYQSHLKQSVDSKEASVYRAINAENINKSNLQSTGIGATACAQHGCFVPNSVVDFQKGERYMNTDYSIWCQWSVNFRSRVKNSPSLLLPPALEIMPSVGKFHLAAHKLSCFPRYSLNFIKGAGHLDGEVLETLWAPFTKISPIARSMTQAHRQEVYDDHMRDSNWKKLVGMVPSLLKKYKNLSRCLEEMNQAYEQLTVLDLDKVAWWELDALRAEADRGEALDIYLLKGDKAPTFHKAWLQPMKNPKSPSGSVGSVAWLAEGIGIKVIFLLTRLAGIGWGLESNNFPILCQLGKKSKSLRRGRGFLQRKLGIKFEVRQCPPLQQGAKISQTMPCAELWITVGS
ncbi:hypothetical protein EDD15DRAFT_2378224 [Pisolithus albus]|nr:hypothetical protein EDD15DRAFT_2378224 [Pisolithus albus]